MNKTLTSIFAGAFLITMNIPALILIGDETRAPAPGVNAIVR